VHSHFPGWFCWSSSGQWWRFDDDRATSVGKDIFKTIVDTQNEEQREEVVIIGDSSGNINGDDEEVKEVKKSPRGKGKGKAKAEKEKDPDVEILEVDEDKEAEEPLAPGYYSSWAQSGIIWSNLDWLIDI